MRINTLTDWAFFQLEDWLVGRAFFDVEEGKLPPQYRVHVVNNDMWVEATPIVLQLEVQEHTRRYPYAVDWVVRLQKYFNEPLGIRVAPFAVGDNITSTFYHRDTVIACFAPKDILFHDGLEVSVRRIFVPSPALIPQLITVVANQYEGEVQNALENQLRDIADQSEVYYQYDTIVEHYRRNGEK